MDPITALQSLVGDNATSVIALITLIVFVAAFVAQFLPAPAADSSAFYKAVYKFVNWAALNNGKAKNRDAA